MDDMAELMLKLARIEGGVERLTARFDDHRAQSATQHQENVSRLSSIEREVRTTNGRVTRNEEHIKTLFAYRDDDRAAERDDEDRDHDRLMRFIEFLGKFGGWIIAALLGVLKLAGKL